MQEALHSLCGLIPLSTNAVHTGGGAWTLTVACLRSLPGARQWRFAVVVFVRHLNGVLLQVLDAVVVRVPVGLHLQLKREYRSMIWVLP